MRYFFSIGLLFLLGLNRQSATAKTMTYTLESFDGHPTKVTLYDKPFGNPFYVSTSTDRFVINDYWSEVSTRRINRHFLALTYAVRCGTGVGSHRTAIICVNQGKLYQAVHLESQLSGYDQDVASLFDLQLKLTGDNTHNYRLVIRSCNDTINGNPQEIKRHYQYAGTLRFDPATCCFRSSRKVISKTISVYDPKTGKLLRRKFAGPYSYTRVGTAEYYLVDREWYSVGENMLFKYSRR